MEFLSNLCRHTKAVNVVRFCPTKELLASGGDGGFVILSKKEMIGHQLLSYNYIYEALNVKYEAHPMAKKWL